MAEERMMVCTYGCKEKPSEPGAAFFKDWRPGSPAAKAICGLCGYHAVAHEKPVRAHLVGKTDHEFAPLPGRDKDEYYCGCRGWD